LALRFLALPVLTTKLRQTTHPSITDITAAVVLAAADITDVDKAECSISRILPVRHPRCRDNNNCALTNLGVEELGVLFKSTVEKCVRRRRPMGDVSTFV